MDVSLVFANIYTHIAAEVQLVLHPHRRGWKSWNLTFEFWVRGGMMDLA